MPITTTIASVAIATAASTVTVPVVRVDPIVQNVPVMTQQYTCNQTQQQVYDQDRALVGGIIGGIVGSQIGNDHSTRRVMTGIGAIMGAQAMGNGGSVPITHCGTSYSQKAVPTVVAYNVTYVVDGIAQTTVMQHDPGQYITVQRTYVVR